MGKLEPTLERRVGRRLRPRTRPAASLVALRAAGQPIGGRGDDARRHVRCRVIEGALPQVVVEIVHQLAHGVGRFPARPVPARRIPADLVEVQRRRAVVFSGEQHPGPYGALGALWGNAGACQRLHNIRLALEPPPHRPRRQIPGETAVIPRVVLSVPLGVQQTVDALVQQPQYLLVHRLVPARDFPGTIDGNDDAEFVGDVVHESRFRAPIRVMVGSGWRPHALPAATAGKAACGPQHPGTDRQTEAPSAPFGRADVAHHNPPLSPISWNGAQ